MNICANNHIILKRMIKYIDNQKEKKPYSHELDFLKTLNN